MVQPDRVPEESRRTTTPRAFVIASTFLIFVLSAFLLGRLTAPEPVHEAGTATTTTILAPPPLPSPALELDDFRVADIQTGGVSWVQTLATGDSEPLTLVELGDLLYLFGGLPGSPGAGLQAWGSDGGAIWEHLGPVIGTEYEIDSVVPTDSALMALGRRISDGTPVILLSDHAREWSPTMLPVPRTLKSGERFSVYDGAALGNRTVVIGDIDLNTRPRVTRPWGIIVAPLSSQDLGEVVDRLGSEPSVSTYAWVSTGSDGWTVTELEALHVETVSLAEDGTITVMGVDDAGRPRRWTSKDGTAWFSSPRPPSIGQVVPWGDGFVGLASLRNGASELMTSEDGQTWAPSRADTLLPDFVEWRLHPLAAGNLGIAVFAEGVNPFAEDSPSELAITVEKSGYSLMLDPGTGELRLDVVETGGNLLTLPPGQEPDSGSLIVRVVDGRDIVFLDPGSNAPLVSFSVEELGKAELERAAAMSGEGHLGALLFSADGDVWSLRDVSGLLGDRWVVELLVIEGGLIAVTRESFFTGADPGFRVWTGILTVDSG